MSPQRPILAIHAPRALQSKCLEQLRHMFGRLHFLQDRFYSPVGANEDRGRDDGLGRPSLRTEQADFRHSALQLVVTFEKISRRIHCSFRHYQWLTLVSKAANRLRAKIVGLRTWVALHRTESRGHFGAVSFILLFVVSTFLPPLAPRALPRFCATMEALSPFGHGSSDPLRIMNAVPFPNRDP